MDLKQTRSIFIVKSVINEFDEHICRICGVDWLKQTKETREDVHDSYCCCCGSQVGYEDKLLKAIKIARQKWLKGSLRWDSPSLQPKGWNKEMALKQIKDNVPEEFQ